MRLSEEGRKFLQVWEGKSLKRYVDVGGRPTIGYGHLIVPGESFPDEITEDFAEDLFNRDLIKYEDAITMEFGDIMSQQQFDACVSLCYNIGIKAFTHSTMARLISDTDYDRAAEQFPLWCHVNGKVSQGLLNRRYAEQEVFVNGNYNHNV